MARLIVKSPYIKCGGNVNVGGYLKYIATLKCSANQNYAPTQYALGKLYLSDDPDVHDSDKGLYWLQQAAESGNDFAAYRLGKKYLDGEHIAKNTETAAFYLERTANDGSAYAQYLPGKLYLMGEGVPKDTDTAYEWFAAAQENGHTYAGFFLDRIDRPEPPSVLLSTTRLLHHMSNISAIRLRPCPPSAASRSTANAGRSCRSCVSPSATHRMTTGTS